MLELESATWSDLQSDTGSQDPEANDLTFSMEI